MCLNWPGNCERDGVMVPVKEDERLLTKNLQVGIIVKIIKKCAHLIYMLLTMKMVSMSSGNRAKIRTKTAFPIYFPPKYSSCVKQSVSEIIRLWTTFFLEKALIVEIEIYITIGSSLEKSRPVFPWHCEHTR